MNKIIVIYLDSEGLPRAHAYGEVENNSDLDDIKDMASRMLDKYIASKTYHLDRSEFTREVEIVD